MKPLRVAVASALLAAPTLPCSAFLAVGDGRILFGNNEDYWNPNTRVWFVPAAEGRHGVMYLGFDNGFPQGGMNDAGLAFDGFATAPHPLTRQAGKKPFVGRSLGAELMETCATVEEVVAFLESVDLSRHFERAMLFFADATGDSVIVEGDELLRGTRDFQAVTNFYQSEHEDDLAACPRYAAVVRTLDGREETSVAVCERALSAAAQRGQRVATLYSNVFDLKARTARLYLFHDFDHAVELDLDEELAKDARTLELPGLFPRNRDWERYVSYQQKSVEERIAERKGPRLSKQALKALEGAYDLELEGKAHRVSLRREGDGLLASSELFESTDGERRFHAASADEFFAVTLSSDLTLRFLRAADGAVTGFTLSAGGPEYAARRVDG